jgi:hypothetical protein
MTFIATTTTTTNNNNNNNNNNNYYYYYNCHYLLGSTITDTVWSGLTSVDTNISIMEAADISASETL